MINKNDYSVVDYKPLLHKKGKRWIVLGLSALSLIGLGTVASTQVSASSVTSNQNQGKLNQSNPQPVTHPLSTKAIGNQADALHAKIVGNQAMYQHKVNSSTPLLKMASTAPKSVSNSSNSSASTMASSSNITKPVSSVSASSSNASSSVTAPSASSVSAKSNNSSSNVTNMTSNSLSNIQSSFINNVNSKGMTGVKVASNPNAVTSIGNSNMSKSNMVSPYTHTNTNSASNVTPTSKITSNAISNSSKSASIGSKSISIASNSSSNVTSNLISNSISNKQVDKANVGMSKRVILGDADDAVNSASDGHWIYSNGKYISSMPSTDTISDGTYDGLNYKYDKTLQALEFTGGSVNVSDTKNFLLTQQFANNTNDSGNYNLKSVKFDNDVDFSNVNNMSEMFYSDGNLRSLELGDNFNTSNVTNMSSMFCSDVNLQSLNLGNKFYTSGVTNMSSMFANDTGIQTLDLGNNFDTSNVSDMSDMFGLVKNLVPFVPMGVDSSPAQVVPVTSQSIILPSCFNTSKVTSMSNMFNGDTLGLLTIQSPNTKFSNKGGSTSLPPMFKAFPEKNAKGKNYTVTTPNDFSQGNVGTFSSVKNPKPADITESVPFHDIYSDIDGMGNQILPFSAVTGTPNSTQSVTINNSDWALVNAQGQPVSSEQVKLSGNPVLNVAPVKDGLVFKYNKEHHILEFVSGKLNVSDAPNFLHDSRFDPNTLRAVKFTSDTDTSNLKNASHMFSNDKRLHSLGLPANFGKNITNAFAMFSGDIRLPKLILPTGFGQNITYGSDMIMSDDNLQSISLPTGFGKNMTNASALIYDDGALQSLNLPQGFGSKITNASDIFSGNSSLQTITLPSGFGQDINNTTGMFYNDSDLQSLTLNNPSQYSPQLKSHLTNPTYEPFQSLYRVLPDKDASGKNYTANATDFTQGNPLSGKYIFTPNPKVSVNDRIYFLDKSNHNSIVGNVQGLVVNGIKGSQYTVQGNQVPKNYKLANDGTQTFDFNGTNHNVTVISTLPPKPKPVPISSKNIDFTGTITLHYHDGNKALKDITLPYDIKSKNNHVINDLLKGTNPSAVIPADYLNKVINQYNTANYIYDNNVKSNQYDNVMIDPRVKGWVNENGNNPIFHNGNITLNFSANNVTENIHYNFNGHKEGNATFTGKNDEQGKDSDAQGLNSGYHISPTNPNNTWTYGNGGSDASGKYNDSDTVNVVPNRDTDNIIYQYKGNKLASDKVTGNDEKATDAGDNFYTINSTNHPSMPAHYHLANNQTVAFGFSNSNHIIPILPDQATDTINYQYSGKTISSHQFSGNNSSAKNASDTTVNINKNNDAGLPTGYHLANTNNQFNYDGNTHNVVIEPNQATDIVDYNYGKQTLGNHDFSGNTDTASGASDTGFDVTAKNDQGIPVGYHLVNKDNQFKYDGSNHTVSIAPDQASAKITYNYGKQVIGHHTFTGNTSIAKGASDTTISVTPNNAPDLPQGYHLASNTNQFNYDNGNHVVNITPNRDTNTVDYITNGNKSQVLGHNQFTGNDHTASGASDTTFTINNNTATGIPSGYHLVNPTTTFNYDNSTDYVEVAKNNGTANVHYVLPNGQSLPASDGNGGNGVIHGNTNSDINPASQLPIPKGYTPAQSDLVNPNKAYDPNTNPIKPYHFGPQNNKTTNQSDNIHVIGNQIKGQAKVHLIYQESNGRVDLTKDVYVPINGRVGDSNIDVSSWSFVADNYNNDNPSDVYFPMSWRQASNGDNLNYNPSTTFTYVAQTGGDIKVNYVDTDPGAKPASGEQTASDGQPIVGTQDLGNQGIVGTQLQLGMIGANDGNGVRDILEVPAGFELDNKVNPITVNVGQGGTTLTVELNGNNPIGHQGLININK